MTDVWGDLPQAKIMRQSQCMCECRGNLGNLLQHWVLCEILEASRSRATKMDFVDAHSMAPLACPRKRADPRRKEEEIFDRVRTQLPGQGTPYEVTWHSLSPEGAAYPNSAQFVKAIWTRRYTLLLCEADSTTAELLEAWAEDASFTEVAAEDWRSRLQRGLSLSGDLAFFSFDPYMFNCEESKTHKTWNPGNMYPSDLICLADVLRRMPQRVIVQLSTYSANNANSQRKVIDEVRTRLAPAGLEVLVPVKANGNMMSLVLARNINWADSLRSLDSRFEDWRKAHG